MQPLGSLSLVGVPGLSRFPQSATKTLAIFQTLLAMRTIAFGALVRSPLPTSVTARSTGFLFAHAIISSPCKGTLHHGRFALTAAAQQTSTPCRRTLGVKIEKPPGLDVSPRSRSTFPRSRCRFLAFLVSLLPAGLLLNHTLNQQFPSMGSTRLDLS